MGEEIDTSEGAQRALSAAPESLSPPSESVETSGTEVVRCSRCGTEAEPTGKGQCEKCGVPAGLVVRMPTDIPAGAIQRTRDIAASVDPALRFTRLATLDSMLRELQSGQRLASLALGLITLSVALLSMASLYALMSFAVVRRRREIDIRSALGGQPRRILASIFSRVLGQVGIGAAVGLALAVPLANAIGQELGSAEAAAFLLAVPTLMMVAGLLAALGPARRGLRIEPTEAIRE